MQAISEKKRLWWSSRTEEERAAFGEKKRLWWSSRTKEEREVISEKKRLWWWSRTEAGQEQQLQPMRQGYKAWRASGTGAEASARSAATNKKNWAKKRDDAFAAASDLDKAVLAKAESISSLRKELGKEYFALCRRLDAPAKAAARDEYMEARRVEVGGAVIVTAS
ncbi:hypothetical protein JCM10296v2_001915 [Rhodotorula toruloides]